jgi:hypothetical protein
MIPHIRTAYNNAFTLAAYEQYKTALDNVYKGSLVFRVAETPVFVDKAFEQKMLSCCEAIIDTIAKPDFIANTNAAIPNHLKVPNENAHTDFIAFDFGVCENSAGDIEPRLIEMQGFPSLFGYQVLQDDVLRNHFNIPNELTQFLNGYTKESYIELLKNIIVANEDPKHVILLEIFPHQQKTKIDFYSTETFIGIKPVCLTELIKEGNEIFYLNGNEKIKIKRIYNRIIFDELLQQPEEIKQKGNMLFEALDVIWVPHPAWFYRISKYTIPFVKHAYIPNTQFVNRLPQIPDHLENYVLKPLFSFAGQGVVIDVTPNDITNLPDPENWILQEKVAYAPVIKTPDDPAKCEIRIFYFWPPNAARPVAVGNLARLSKGKMVGVRYNADKEWVGGSIAYFEK